MCMSLHECMSVLTDVHIVIDGCFAFYTVSMLATHLELQNSKL